MISSAGNTWNNGHKSIYNYYTNWYSTGKCKAKLWSLDYTPSGSKEFKKSNPYIFMCNGISLWGELYINGCSRAY